MRTSSDVERGSFQVQTKNQRSTADLKTDLCRSGDFVKCINGHCSGGFLSWGESFWGFVMEGLVDWWISSRSIYCIWYIWVKKKGPNIHSCWSKWFPCIVEERHWPMANNGRNAQDFTRSFQGLCAGKNWMLCIVHRSAEGDELALGEHSANFFVPHIHEMREQIVGNSWELNAFIIWGLCQPLSIL